MAFWFSRFQRFWLSRGYFVAFALGYALLFMYLAGGGLDRLYSRSPYHRLQADAMLHGQFGLADSIYQVGFDLAWCNGQIQQVWGLGVGLWLMPFDLLARCFGLADLPDRAALGILVFLYALYCGFTSLKLGRDWHSQGLGAGLCFVLLFFPPFWIMAMAPQLVYEETVLYACLASQILLVTLIRFAVYQRNRDYLWCCLLGGFLGLIRPTHFIYGFAAVLISTGLMLRLRPRQRVRSPKAASGWAWNSRRIAAGMVCFSCGLLFLAWSNQVRFGSPFEFGHTMTATAMPTLFFSRFSAPYTWHDTIPLAKELFAWIFLPSLQQGHPWNEAGLVYFQASVPRWRDIYFPTLNFAYLALIVLGLGWGIIRLTRQLRVRGWRCFLNQPVTRLTVALVGWVVLGMTPLFAFYTHTNSMSSRYVMDFAPAILGGVLLAGGFCCRHWPRVTLIILILGVLGDLSRIRHTPILNQPTQVPYIRGLAPSMGATLDEFSGSYDQDAHPADTELWCNGFGWGRNGLAGPNVVVAVDAPQFVELNLGPRIGSKGERDIYRARIGSCELPVTSVTSVNKTIRVRFEVPEVIRRRAGEELVFLCFVKTVLPLDLDSRRILHSVKWR